MPSKKIGRVAAITPEHSAVGYARSAVLLDHDTIRRLHRARVRLQTIGSSSPTIAELAKSSGFSEFHFIRLFAAVFGETPHKLRTRARLDHAKRRLALADTSVTELCMELGFSSVGSFSALFSRRVGVSPSAYRRSTRALVQVPARLRLEFTPGCLSLMARLPAEAFRSFREVRAAPSCED